MFALPARTMVLPSSRHFSSSVVALSKASKARIAKPSPRPRRRLTTHESLIALKKAADIVASGNGEAGAQATAPEKSSEQLVQGKRRGAAASGGLGEAEDSSYTVPEPKEKLSGARVVASEAVVPPPAEAAARPATGSSSSAQGATSTAEPASSKENPDSDGYGPETPFYTAIPPYNVPLVLTAAFVMSVGCALGADTARVGLTEYDEETKEWKLAPAAQRWPIALGLTVVAVAAASWGALFPSRIITKMTIRRPQGATTRFPQSSLVTLYTPVSKFPFYPKRSVPLSSIHLLGPLSNDVKPWHPVSYVPPPRPPRKGPIFDALRSLSDTLIAKPTPKPRKNRSAAKAALSHVPILLDGDRFSYSIQKTRAPSGRMGDEKGAWCEDWEGLEKALLGVPEVGGH